MPSVICMPRAPTLQDTSVRQVMHQYRYSKTVSKTVMLQMQVFVSYGEDQNIQRLQPKFQRHMLSLSISKSLQVAPEAQLGALLLVDVLTATNVAAINAPHDQQQDEGTNDVQQMQHIVCGSVFEDTLKNARTGDRLDLRSPYMYASNL